MSLKELAMAVVDASEKGDLTAAIQALGAELKRLEQTGGDQEEVIQMARRAYCDDDDIQIDEDAEVSETDDGAWVSAWVWVSTEEMMDPFAPRIEDVIFDEGGAGPYTPPEDDPSLVQASDLEMDEPGKWDEEAS
ncbi:hypothetical protein [Hydrogenophaga sp. NFH-34]|uniref:hypothetical protein n=1 Tax=Hydrogenophaga sp. NFH-34 TaxID=2744446 RepID=UPI001F373802|nr:hypothetical protein [Hydrogenophaga sp. NFH-34]